MRTENTIRQRIAKAKASKYREAFVHEIGILSWVLGDAPTPRAGIIREHQEAKAIHDAFVASAMGKQEQTDAT